LEDEDKDDDKILINPTTTSTHVYYVHRESYMSCHLI